MKKIPGKFQAVLTDEELRRQIRGNWSGLPPPDEHVWTEAVRRRILRPKLSTKISWLQDLITTVDKLISDKSGEVDSATLEEARRIQTWLRSWRYSLGPEMRVRLALGGFTDVAFPPL